MGGVHGVCYGMLGDNLPSRADLVQLYNSNNINAMRIYSPDHAALDALPRQRHRPHPRRRRRRRRPQPRQQRLRCRRLGAGQRATLPRGRHHPVRLRRQRGAPRRRRGDPPPGHAERARRARVGRPRRHQGVSTAVRMDVFANTFPPSSGACAQVYMADVARYLASTGAPLLSNVYPYFAYRDNLRDISLNYATFRPGTAVRDAGNGLVYTNIFDAMVDAIYAALEKAGAPSVGVVVSETGWPSAGGFAANVENARAHNQGVIDHVRRGTPKRPGVLETYRHACQIRRL
ncbi:glucan endo-1,3-beta-glucosidase GV-like [Panicum miliaceum]|uniref:Glucan endo-1,3-beta-glucosidase GV-like n=1 Tax=Panicum miliaceum TaxID=4540 RepID=A0A3L6SN45_PANMI|nr:glucan endo-1,3-beta-glucosidase GV-like [Panicum miliaceum]